MIPDQTTKKSLPPTAAKQHDCNTLSHTLPLVDRADRCTGLFFILVMMKSLAGEGTRRETQLSSFPKCPCCCSN